MVTDGRIRTAALVVLALASTNAWSQPVLSDPVLPATHPELRVGRRVWVTLADGPVIQGKITSVTDSELGLSSDQSVKLLPWRTVRLIKAKDSLENGFFAGWLIGALGGTVVGALTSDKKEVMAYSVLTGWTFAIPIALLIDHAHTGYQTIYFASAKVSLGPTLAPGRFGVGAAVRW